MNRFEVNGYDLGDESGFTKIEKMTSKNEIVSCVENILQSRRYHIQREELIRMLEKSMVIDGIEKSSEDIQWDSDTREYALLQKIQVISNQYENLK